MNVPDEVGVPLTSPPLFKVSPGGKAPLETTYVYGDVPPLAVKLCEYDAPTVAPGRLGGLIVIGEQEMFVRLNTAGGGSAPMVEAKTWYDPATEFAVTLTFTGPPVIVAFELGGEMLAPVGGPSKKTMPPLTGSLKGLVTETIKGDENGVPILVDCESPLTTETENPRDSKEPLSIPPNAGRLIPRWSVAGAPEGLPALIAGLPGNKA